MNVDLFEMQTWLASLQANGPRRYPVIRTKRTATRNPVYTDVRQMVYARDVYQCRFCSCGGDLTLDHIIPWSAGGTENTRNLRTLCWDCNEKRSNYRQVYEERLRPGVVDYCIDCRFELSRLAGYEVDIDEDGEGWSTDIHPDETEQVWCGRCTTFTRGLSLDVLDAAITWPPEQRPFIAADPRLPGILVELYGDPSAALRRSQ